MDQIWRWCVQYSEDCPVGGKRVQCQRAASCARATELQERLEGDNEGGVEVSVRAGPPSNLPVAVAIREPDNKESSLSCYLKSSYNICS
jgi:hypothetical protein